MRIYLDFMCSLLIIWSLCYFHFDNTYFHYHQWLYYDSLRALWGFVVYTVIFALHYKDKIIIDEKINFKNCRTTSFTEDWDYFASLPPTSRFLYGFTFCVLALYLYLKRPWKYPPGPLIIPFLGSLPFLLFAKGNGILDVLNGLKTRFGGVYSLGWAGKWVHV